MKTGSIEKKHGRWGYVFIAPWVIGFLAFQLYPLLASLFYSFTNASMLNKIRWVGLQNYIDLFTRDPDFINSMLITMKYTVIAVPAKLLFALLVALILNQRLRAINMFRSIYYLPSIMGGSVAISIVWRFFFMQSGVVNSLLGAVGLPAVSWLGNPDVALYTITLLIVWQFGSSMVLFLAGLKQIPESLYEASHIDGAGRLRVLFNITLPMLTPIIFFNLVMQSINVLQDFTAAFIVTNGGPMKATYMMGLKIYDDAFRFMKMGYASATSWILFIIIVLLTGLLFRSSGSWVHYEDGGT
jgi:oligogalacturonide transport system permease protein